MCVYGKKKKAVLSVQEQQMYESRQAQRLTFHASLGTRHV